MANAKHCEGLECPQLSEQIRIVPVDDSTNLHLCQHCYNSEVATNLVSIPFCLFPTLDAELDKLDIEDSYTSIPEYPQEEYSFTMIPKEEWNKRLK